MKTKSRIFYTVIFSLVLALPMVAAEYEVDKKKSKVKWNGKKVTGEHYGTIALKSGTLEVDDNKIESGTFQMDMTSIVNEDLKDESTNANFVGHLKSDDFFSVDKHPVSTLVLTNVKHKTGNTYVFSGNLTIKGITHPVSFDAKVDVNNDKLAANGKIEVDRTLYDIRFRSGKFFPDLGDKLIYDTFSLDFNIVATAGAGTAMLITK